MAGGGYSMIDLNDPVVRDSIVQKHCDFCKGATQIYSKGIIVFTGSNEDGTVFVATTKEANNNIPIYFKYCPFCGRHLQWD